MVDFEWLSNNTQDAIVALEPGDEESLWYTQLSIKIAKGPRVKIDFRAWITQLQGGAWDVMIQLQNHGVGPEHETQATTQNISLSHNCEFSIESCGAPTLVRPVWIPISEFQAQLPPSQVEGGE
jgi:hypothetical protein